MNKIEKKSRKILEIFRKQVFPGLAYLTVVILFVGVVQAVVPGSRDFSFGQLGKAIPVTTAPNGVDIYSIAVQSDGKVVAVGTDRFYIANGSENISVRRYNTDGTPDTSFGNNGVFIYDHFGQLDAAYSVVIQSDGKIVVVGGGFRESSNFPPNPNNIKGIKILRLLPNGTFDSTFGTNGFAYENFNMAIIPRSIFIQPDGKIVIAGTDYSTRILVSRFNANGSVDSGFGTNGAVVFNNFNESELKITPQTDGKIVVVALNDPGADSLIRLNPNGSMDTEFAGGGQTQITLGDRFSVPELAVQQDNKILVSVYRYGQSLPVIQRYNPDGSVDSSFNPSHGDVLSDRGCVNCTKSVSKILPLPDGKFYTVGNVYGYTYGTFAKPIISVSRYLENGTIDQTFGFRGTYFLLDSIGNPSVYNNNQFFYTSDAALQADGKVVISTYKDVRRILVTKTPGSMRADFDGDRRTDVSVFRPSSGAWYYLKSSTNNSAFSGFFFGINTDVLLPGDYNYDLKTDASVYRSSDNYHYTQPSRTNEGYTGNISFGLSSDVRVPADYDGDGYTDVAVFRPSNGNWIIRYSQQTPLPRGSDQYINTTVAFGFGTDIPVPADYDGDGKADIAVFRPSNGVWYILRSSDGGFTAIQFGLGTDKLVPGDYDGDGKADIAVIRDGNWYVLRSADNSFYGITWGFGTDKAVPGDYDGDGKFDFAVYRPSDGAWYILKSSDSSFQAYIFGASEDIPIPFLFTKN